MNIEKHVETFVATRGSNIKLGDYCKKHKFTKKQKALFQELIFLRAMKIIMEEKK